MSGIGDSLSELSRILHRGCYVIPGYLHHHDGAVGGHAGVEAGGEVAVVLVEDGAHGGVLAGDGYSQDGVVWFDGLGVGQVEGEVVEAQMQEVYRRLYVSEADRQEIERYLLAELARIEGEKDRSVQSLTVRRTNLEDERRRLLQAHYGGAVPLELLKEEQDRLGRELVGIQRQLDAYQADAKLVRAHVEQALDLLEDCYRLYMAAPDHLRKQLNQVFFERVLVDPAVDEDGRVILPGEGGDGLRGEDDGSVKGAGDEPDGQRGRDEQEIAVGRRQPIGGSQADDAGDEPTGRVDEAPCSVRVADTGSDVCLEARLNQPRPAGQRKTPGCGTDRRPTKNAHLGRRWATVLGRDGRRGCFSG